MTVRALVTFDAVFLFAEKEFARQLRLLFIVLSRSLMFVPTVVPKCADSFLKVPADLLILIFHVVHLLVNHLLHHRKHA
jgi:hypothetical protein